MKLQDMSKEEILESIDVLMDCTGSLDPESLYEDRDEIIDGHCGDIIWKLCKKYRQPLIDYIFRDRIERKNK